MVIKNAQWSPLSIKISEGKTITLEPRGIAKLSEKEFQSEDCQKYFREEKIFVLPESY